MGDTPIDDTPIDDTRLFPLGCDRVETVMCAVRATLDGDSSVVDALFTADVQASLPATVGSATGLAVEIEDRAGVFANVEVHPVADRVVGDEVWVEWTASVIHVGPFAVDDVEIPPSGRRAELHGATVAEFGADGRIAGFRQYWDCGALLEGTEDRPHRARLQRG